MGADSNGHYNNPTSLLRYKIWRFYGCRSASFVLRFEIFRTPARSDPVVPANDCTKGIEGLGLWVYALGVDDSFWFSDKAMQKLRKRREQSRHHALYKCTETLQKSVPSLLLNSAWGLTGIGVRIRALCIACDYGHYKGLNN